MKLRRTDFSVSRFSNIFEICCGIPTDQPDKRFFLFRQPVGFQSPNWFIGCPFYPKATQCTNDKHRHFQHREILSNARTDTMAKLRATWSATGMPQIANVDEELLDHTDNQLCSINLRAVGSASSQRAGRNSSGFVP
jgi:hypothetical protein